jgi:hypothetical protein
MGMQGQRAGLGSRGPTWAEEVAFWIALWSCAVLPVLLVGALASALSN